MSSQSWLEDLYWQAWITWGKSQPTPERQHRFYPNRRWAFDFAWPLYKVAVEIEGGVWSGGRHTRAAGFIKDCEKYNAAVLMGWRVLRFPTPALDNPELCVRQTIDALKVALEAKNGRVHG